MLTSPKLIDPFQIVRIKHVRPAFANASLGRIPYPNFLKLPLIHGASVPLGLWGAVFVTDSSHMTFGRGLRESCDAAIIIGRKD